MATKPPLKLGMIEPRAAIEAFQKRGLLAPSFRWEDIWQAEHSAAFAVAGVSRLDVLQLFHDEVGRAVAGESLRDVKKRLIPQLVAKGFWGEVEVEDPATGEKRISKFNDARLKLIFNTNLRQSRAAGHWQQIVRNKDKFPFIIYRTREDERVRASHRSWHNLVLPVDHEFWDTHFPPNGWGCRCLARSVSEKELSSYATKEHPIKRDAPEIEYATYVNKRTGEITPIPRGIDPGFAYNPGKQRDAGLHEQMMNKALSAVPLSAAVAVAQAQQANPMLLIQTTEAFGRWVSELLVGSPMSSNLKYVGVVKPQVVRALEAIDRPLVSSAIAVTDSDVRHVLRNAKKRADGAGIDTDTYKLLPDLIDRAEAVFHEIAEDGKLDALLYVLPLPQDRSMKLVIQLNKSIKAKVSGARQRIVANVVHTVTLMNPQALRDTRRYQLLWGSM